MTGADTLLSAEAYYAYNAHLDFDVLDVQATVVMRLNQELEDGANFDGASEWEAYRNFVAAVERKTYTNPRLETHREVDLLRGPIVGWIWQGKTPLPKVQHRGYMGGWHRAQIRYANGDSQKWWNHGWGTYASTDRAFRILSKERNRR